MSTIADSFCRAGDKKRSSFVVAVDDATGTVVGCALLLLGAEHAIGKGAKQSVNDKGPGNRHIVVSDAASVSKVSVAASARRLGVGKKLMHHLEAVAKGWGCTRIELATGNQKAISFYESLGFTVDKSSKLLPWASFRGAEMSRNLGSE
jgi:ribosomal protein S18 acetylase RimI-like enzyme